MIVIGDAHRCWADLVSHLVTAGVRNQNLVQVGDFGLGFGDARAEARQLALLDRYLVQTGSRLWAIRGNHDDPARWAPEAAQPWQAIRLVPDYSVIDLEGKRLLCVGGAISVDRTARSIGAYWHDEGFVLAPDRLARLDLTDLYAVVTHSAPEGIYPYEFGDLVYHYALRDPQLLAELWAERRALAQFRDLVTERARPLYWCYGHFHAHMVEAVGPTRFVLVDVLQCYDLAAGVTV
jgi:UDP-2,3-diacylglucosamine pyrophosphatase LpxH